MEFSTSDIINIANRSNAKRDKLLEKVVYLLWYNHMTKIGGNLKSDHHELAREYFGALDDTVYSWGIGKRDIKELL